MENWMNYFPAFLPACRQELRDVHELVSELQREVTEAGVLSGPDTLLPCMQAALSTCLYSTANAKTMLTCSHWEKIP